MADLGSKPKIGIISQARMTSTRLPGKILKEIGGKTLLQYHVERIQKYNPQATFILATTTNATDEPVVNLADKLGVEAYRGSENDVLSRFHEAATKFQLDIIVRVTSDCPLIDGELIQTGIQKYLELKNPWLYVSNVIERTYPRGFDFEVFSKEMLDAAFSNANTPSEREHVTPYFYLNAHGKTQFHHIKQNPSFSRFRLTVDEPTDFLVIEKLISKFHCDKMNQNEICEVLLKHPEIASLNASIEQKKI